MTMLKQRHGLTSGDRITVVLGATKSTCTVKGVFEYLIIVLDGSSVYMHIKWDAGLGAWTVGKRRVTITKENN